MKRTSAFILASIALLAPTAVNAQDKLKLQDVLTFKARVQAQDPFDPRNEVGANGNWKARRGEVIRVELLGSLKAGWNTYPVTQRTSEQLESQLTKLTVLPAKGATSLWPLYESAPLKYYEKALGQTYFKYVNGFAWSQDVLIDKDAAPGTLKVEFKLHIQLCSGACEWFDHVVPVNIEVSDEPAESMSAEVSARLKAEKPKIEVVKVESPKSEDAASPTTVARGGQQRSAITQEGLIRVSQDVYMQQMDAIAEQIKSSGQAIGADADADLLSFILAGMFWGAISLITPCVFPMIPITVSFFLKQSEKEHHRPIVMASVYCLTIIIVLTSAAAFLLAFFQKMSVHPVTNYLIGGVFIFFALSLFGMYEIELPHSLAQYTSAREGKGGFYGTIFMALTFTIISFACVAPFLGGFGGTAAGNRPIWHNLVGGFAFALTFASPFFFLALFPALLRKLPKSGSWLNAVKVVMGFLEFAAAFKFFRTGELAHSAGAPSFFTYDLVLALWVGMCVLCTLYLLGFFRLPHDTPEENISVPRLLFSMAFLGLAMYLAPALFKVDAAGAPQRPGGSIYAWIDAFLLPDSNAGSSEVPSTANLHHAIAEARTEARKTGKPKRIFIDHTGVTCSNCKINEKSVFSKPEIQKLFAPYIFVKLYTDTVPAAYYAVNDYTEARGEADGAVNRQFQSDVFNSTQLPLYVIIEVDADSIRVVAIYDEARINKEAAFAEFLRNPERK
jgi:thiol:disulfide interchange protein DsbD